MIKGYFFSVYSFFELHILRKTDCFTTKTDSIQLKSFYYSMLLLFGSLKIGIFSPHLQIYFNFFFNLVHLFCFSSNVFVLQQPTILRLVFESGKNCSKLFFNSSSNLEDDKRGATKKLGSNFTTLRIFKFIPFWDSFLIKILTEFYPFN